MNSLSRRVNYQNRFIDVLTVFISWQLAYYFRFEVQIIGGPDVNISFIKYSQFGFLLSLLAIITFKNLHIYEWSKFKSLPRELFNIVRANLINSIIFLVLTYFFTQDRVSRSVIILFFFISSILLIFVKIKFRMIMVKLPIKLVFVGDGESIKKYYNIIKGYSNYKILRWFDAPKEYANLFPINEQFDPQKLEDSSCDGVLVGFNTVNANKAEFYVEELSKYIMSVIILPDVEFAKLGYTIMNFRGIPMLSINDPNIKEVDLITKRTFDLIACCFGMLAISPLLGLLAILVKLTSKGPIFYSQERVGIDGNTFKMWKFRSMITCSKNNQTWTVKNDPRVTKIGSFLRKTSIDELPQLWNVIIGDMSLVGPRPERPMFVNEFRKEIPNYMLRHKMKAGITGWAQVNGWRGDTSIEKRIECDIWYVKNWSFKLDISIIFLTFWKGFINKNAY